MLPRFSPPTVKQSSQVRRGWTLFTAMWPLIRKDRHWTCLDCGGLGRAKPSRRSHGSLEKESKVPFSGLVAYCLQNPQKRGKEKMMGTVIQNKNVDMRCGGSLLRIRRASSENFDFFLGCSRSGGAGARLKADIGCRRSFPSTWLDRPWKPCQASKPCDDVKIMGRDIYCNHTGPKLYGTVDTGMYVHTYSTSMSIRYGVSQKFHPAVKYIHTIYGTWCVYPSLTADTTAASTAPLAN